MILKVRAWIPELKTMVYAPNLIRDKDSGLYEVLTAPIKRSAVIMICTNFLDKNNLEIYEGDIVRASHNYGEGSYESILCKVQYVNNLMMFVLVDTEHNDYSMLDNVEILEVVGNIYENPGLLDNTDEKHRNILKIEMVKQEENYEKPSEFLTLECSFCEVIVPATQWPEHEDCYLQKMANDCQKPVLNRFGKLIMPKGSNE